MAERIHVQLTTSETRITIGPPSAGVGEWLAVAGNLLFVGLIGVFVVSTLRTSTVDEDFMKSYALPGSIAAVGVVMSIAFLLQVLDLIWKLTGVEYVVIDALRVRRTRRLGFVCIPREAALSAISNVGWREERVVGKGRSYLRPLVSFDCSGKSFRLGTNLLLAEATTLARHVEEAVGRFR